MSTYVGPNQELVDSLRTMHPTPAESVRRFEALTKALAPDTRPISVQRMELLALREKEIMQNRLAQAIASNKPLKKMSYGERLQLRIQINRQLPEE